MSCQLLYVPNAGLPVDEALTRGYLLLWAVTGLSVAVAVHEAREKAAVEGLARVLLKTMGPWVKKTPGYLQEEETAVRRGAASAGLQRGEGGDAGEAYHDTKKAAERSEQAGGGGDAGRG